MTHAAGALPAGLVKAFDCVRAGGGFAGGAPGVVGEVFEFPVAGTVQLNKVAPEEPPVM